mmetsp:Transcript_54238/g.79503  ORF Transcript_54238/g.79503 Transcript_54238/m.79503 type:complete len:414 (-) Transcript_54238:52-1293(-)
MAAAMRMLALLVLLCACFQHAGAFVPAPYLVLRAADGSVSRSRLCPALGCITMGGAVGRRELLESGKKMMLLTTLAPLFEPTAAHAFTVPAGAMQGDKSAEMSNVLQGAVLECENLEDELAFWIQGLKMKILRKTAGSVVVGFGPESLDQEKGGHFSLQLVQARGNGGSTSTGKLKIEMTLPARTNLIIDGEEAGGKLEPAWFGASGYIVFVSPSGFLVRIEPTKQKTVAYPIKAVAIQTDDVAATSAQVVALLAIKPDDGFQLPFTNAKSKTFRFIESEGVGQNVALIIEPLDAPPPAQMSKAALLKKKQEEAKLAEADNEGTPTAKTAKQSNFMLSVVSDSVEPSTLATSTGLRIRVMSNDSFEAAMPAPPPAAPAVAPAASAGLAAGKTSKASANGEGDSDSSSNSDDSD